MDRPPLLDTRLMDLTPFSKPRYAYALELARMQAWTYQNTGHLIALADEYVWRRLKAHDGDGLLPDVRARCLCVSLPRRYAIGQLRQG